MKFEKCLFDLSNCSFWAFWERKRSGSDSWKIKPVILCMEEWQLWKVSPVMGLVGTQETEGEEEPIAGPSQEEASPKKRGWKQVITPSLSAALDRAGLLIVSETAESLDHDLQPMVLSRSSIWRQCQKHQKDTATEFPIIVHWDGNSSKISLIQKMLISSLC